MILSKKEKRERRHRKTRSIVAGSAARPRMSVAKSNRQVSAQLIDDGAGRTLVCATSNAIEKGTLLEKAKLVGKELASKAHAQKIEAVVFDRGGYRFAGIIKALAEGAREGGLRF